MARKYRHLLAVYLAKGQNDDLYGILSKLTYKMQSAVPITNPISKYIVQDALAIYMAKWEIIAREFLRVAYISMDTA